MSVSAFSYRGTSSDATRTADRSKSSEGVSLIREGYRGPNIGSGVEEEDENGGEGQRYVHREEGQERGELCGVGREGVRERFLQIAVDEAPCAGQTTAFDRIEGLK